METKVNVCQVLPVTDSCSSKDAQIIQQYTPLRVTKRAFGPYFDVILSMNGVELSRFVHSPSRAARIREFMSRKHMVARKEHKLAKVRLAVVA